MKFKVGDRVRMVSDTFCDQARGKTGVIVRAEKDYAYGIKLDEPADVDMQWGSDDDIELVTEGAVPSTPANVAMRFNSDKPKLSYLLGFKGGIEALFGVTAAEQTGLSALARWYQGGEVEDLVEATGTMLGWLGRTWESDMAAVCVFGENKYARGNFLKGRSVSDSCDSLIRHLIALVLRGEKDDPESKLPHRGHIAWNILFIGHCAEEERFDDRLFKGVAA